MMQFCVMARAGGFFSACVLCRPCNREPDMQRHGLLRAVLGVNRNAIR